MTSLLSFRARVPGAGAGVAGLGVVDPEAGLLDRRGQLINPGHRLVERQRLDIGGHSGNGLVHLAIERQIVIS